MFWIMFICGIVTVTIHNTHTCIEVITMIIKREIAKKIMNARDGDYILQAQFLKAIFPNGF